METVRELDIVRALPAQSKPLTLTRAAGDSGMPLLEVRFSPFNKWYEVNSWWEGNFLERTVLGSFAKTMSEARAAAVMPVKMLYDHGYDPSIGNKPLCPVDELDEETDSAVARGTLFDTQYVRELIPGLDAGVFGSSFRFRVLQESWNDEPGTSDYNPKGIPERTITEIRLFEQGPVTFPASPTATAGLRAVSMTDAYYDQLRTRQPARVDALAVRARAIRTPDQPAAATSTAAVPGAALHLPDEPTSRHSAGSDQRRRREALFPFLTKGE